LVFNIAGLLRQGMLVFYYAVQGMPLARRWISDTTKVLKICGSSTLYLCQKKSSIQTI